MRKWPKILLVTAILVALTVLAPTLAAYPGGWQDTNVEYGCATCHTKTSTVVMTMSASVLTPSPGQSVTVNVTVTGGESTGTLPLGVMLLSAFTSTNSMPSADGWTITSDPSGSTAYNYYQIPDYDPAQLHTLIWTLTAPSTTGAHVLYAREVHGDGNDNAYSTRYQAGISFVVGGVVGAPVVDITSPAAGSTVSGSISVTTNVVSEYPIESAVLRIDGVEVGSLTEAPFAWNVSTTAYTDGQHVINVTATDSHGNTGYGQATVTIGNAAVNEATLQWVWTMAAGTIVIVALMSLAIMGALLVRKMMMEKVK